MLSSYTTKNGVTIKPGQSFTYDGKQHYILQLFPFTNSQLYITYIRENEELCENLESNLFCDTFKEALNTLTDPLPLEVDTSEPVPECCRPR